MATGRSTVTRIKHPREIIIAPSLLSADFSQLATEIRRVERADCEWLHLDIMDNHFVPNLTFGPPVVKALRKVSRRIYFDAHLMVEDPLSLVAAFADAGVQNLTIHEETCKGSLPEAVKTIRNAGMKVGVSIKPDTPLSNIEFILPHVDLVLIMTVEPGFGGQALIPHTLNKIQSLCRLRDRKKLKFQIQADGGVNVKTAELVVAAGAEILVAGSAVFANGKVSDNVKELKRAARAGQS